MLNIFNHSINKIKLFVINIDLTRDYCNYINKKE